jgi:5'-nucleotidase (lipoprotein e(P4) family)
MSVQIKQFKWESVTALATSALAVATLVAVGFAWWQTLDAAHARTAQDYLELRKTFLQVDADLDKVNRSLVYTEAGGCPQWHVLKRYWYFSETEWKVAQIDGAQRKNWDETQLPQVANSLRRPAYRAAFIEMKDSPARRLADEEGKRFVKAVTDQYESIRQAAMKKGEDPGKPLEDKSDFQVAPSCAESAVMADGVHWYRDSTEMKAIYTETYRAASAVAKDAARRLPAESWGVILDIDETVLDNSEYQKELAATGASYSDANFLDWLKRQDAAPLPGVAEFVQSVNSTWHGKVVLVTNQTPDQCEQTRHRLQTLTIHYDRMLCDDTHSQDKNERFTMVQQGDPGHHIPPLKVVLWMGDNIRDFPNLSQSSPGDSAQFGVRYFVLPNPMYGSWVNTPRR